MRVCWCMQSCVCVVPVRVYDKFTFKSLFLVLVAWHICVKHARICFNAWKHLMFLYCMWFHIQKRQMTLNRLQSAGRKIQQEEKLKKMIATEDTYLSQLKTAWEDSMNTTCIKKQNLLLSKSMVCVACNRKCENVWLPWYLVLAYVVST